MHGQERRRGRREGAEGAEWRDRKEGNGRRRPYEDVGRANVTVGNGRISRVQVGQAAGNVEGESELELLVEGGIELIPAQAQTVGGEEENVEGAEGAPLEHHARGIEHDTHQGDRVGMGEGADEESGKG